MGVIDDIGVIPLKFAEQFYKKGYFIYIMLLIVVMLFGCGINEKTKETKKRT